MRYCAGPLLVEKRHAVCKPQDLHFLLLREISSIGYTCFYLERVSAVHRRRARYGLDKIYGMFFLKPFSDQFIRDRGKTIRGRSRYLYLRESLVQPLCFIQCHFLRAFFWIDTCLFRYLFSSMKTYAGKGITKERGELFPF